MTAPDTLPVTAGPGTAKLRSLDDLTKADVDALEAFLTSRLARLVEAHPVGSEEWRVAWSMKATVCSLAIAVRRNLRARAPSRATGTSGFGAIWTLLYSEECRRDWNRLHSLAVPWHTCTGYDTLRWRHLKWHTKYEAVMD